MGFYKFIKIKGPERDRIGYYIPRLYRLVFTWHELKHVGLQFVKVRLAGWTIWWVSNEDDYIQAIKILDELKKTHIFDYKVSM